MELRLLLGAAILPSKLGCDFLHLFAEGFPFFEGKDVIGGQALYRFSHNARAFCEFYQIGLSARDRRHGFDCLCLGLVVDNKKDGGANLMNPLIFARL
jgi:hypothetical protein